MDVFAGLLFACYVMALVSVVVFLVMLAHRIDRRETIEAATAWMRATTQVDLVEHWKAAGQPNLYARRWRRSGLTDAHRHAWVRALRDTHLRYHNNRFDMDCCRR